MEKEHEDVRQHLGYIGEKVSSIADYNRRNCLEIHGIPESRGENLSGKVIELGRSLGVEVEKHHFDALPHRLPARVGIKPVIVKFVHQHKREEFMNSKKGKWVKAVENGFEVSGRIDGPRDKTINWIYLNDSLTPEKRHLAMKARTFFKEKNCNVWTVSSGKIFVSEIGSSRKHEINNIGDLETVNMKLDG